VGEAIIADIAIPAATAIGCGGGGVLAGPTGTTSIPAGCGAGFVAGLSIDVSIASTASPVEPIENGFGWLAAGITAYIDWRRGYSTYNNGTLYIGNDTIVSARNALLGQIPESNGDFFISLSQFKYDLDRSFWETLDNHSVNMNFETFQQGVNTVQYILTSDWWR
jgi:hypothetical protein